MRQIELTDEETQILTDMLDQEFRNLKEEIYKTETRGFKEALKAREALLVGLLTKLGHPPVVQAA